MLSILERNKSAGTAAEEAAPVRAARTRARRRLLGAVVLVGLGIIAFPLLFESQPRPILIDVPIEIPDRATAPPLAVPVPRTAASGPVAVHSAAPPRIEDRAAAAPPAAASAVAAREAAGRAGPDTESEARRAQALLDGKPVAQAAAEAAPPSARYVVQAGAYSDAAALSEARQKVEKLGLKTYIQVVQTDAGARTRVRVGPFASRDEADKVAARIKGAGLAVNVLSL